MTQQRRKRKIKRYNFLLYILLLILVCIGVYLTIHFRSTGYSIGNETKSNLIELLDSGNNVLQNFTSIQACINAVSPGQTCVIYQGTYSECLKIDKSGTAGNYIKLLGASGTPMPILTCPAPTTDGIKIGSNSPTDHGREYIWIENLEITGSGSDGIRGQWALNNGTSNIVLKNLYIHDVLWNGIYLGGSGRNWLVENLTVTNVGGHCLKLAEYDIDTVTIKNNKLSNCGFYAANNGTRNPYGIQVSYATGYGDSNVSNFNIEGNVIDGPMQAGINVNIANHNFTIKNNIIRNAWQNVSGDLGTGMGAIQITTQSTTNNFDIHVINNTIYNSKWLGASFATGSAPGSSYEFSRNLVYNNSKSGLSLGNNGNTTAVIVDHNTFFNNGDSTNYEVYIPYKPTSNIQFKNNILFHTGITLVLFSDRKLLNDTFNYNLYWKPIATTSTDVVTFTQDFFNNPLTLAEFKSLTGRESSGILGDPIFNSDLSPALNSPACHAGEASSDIGALACSSGTTNVSNVSQPPVAVCGNSVIETGEACDNGTNNNVACTPSYGSNCIYCSSSCTTVNVNGAYCGDNIINGNEACDGTSLAGKNCSSFMGTTYTGNLTCSQDCVFDASKCIQIITIPSNPSTLTASAVAGKKINLAWKDNSANENGFMIFRSLKATSGFTNIANASANAIVYTDSTGLSAGKIYYYQIKSFNSAGYSSVSNTASATALK
jgi:hypothetical protein